MRRARIEYAAVGVGVDVGHVVHVQLHPVVGTHSGGVHPVAGQETVIWAAQAERVGEVGHAASAVAAQAAGAPVGVEVDHLEIVVGVALQQDEPVGSDAETAVAESRDAGGIAARQVGPVALVDEHEIVAGALVFGEGEHGSS